MSVDTVITAVKKVRDISQKIHDAELTNTIADLTFEAAGLKMEMAQLKTENLELRRQLDQLRTQADIRKLLEFKNGVYYLTEPVEGYHQGPFCSTCFDTDGLLVSVWQNEFGLFFCNRCSQHCSQKPC